MKTIIVSDAKSGEVKLRVPKCTIRPDGSIWRLNEMPILITSHLPNHEELKRRYTDALRNKRWSDIAPEHYAHLGWCGECIVETQDEYTLRLRRKYSSEKNGCKNVHESKQICVYLSSRGWGDYSPVEWRGDATRPTSEIVKECQGLLASQHDVDNANQTDAELAGKIDAAKEAEAKKQKESAEAARAAEETKVPQSAINAYIACNGDPEDLEDDIDNPAYWLVRKYASAIEAQGLAPHAAATKMVRELHQVDERLED